MERKTLFSCFRAIWLESVVLIRLITPKRNTSHESTSMVKKNEDMGVGSMVEISFGEGQPSVSVTISGLYAPAKAYSGHGRMHLDGATLFAPEALFHELHPEIASNAINR